MSTSLRRGLLVVTSLAVMAATQVASAPAGNPSPVATGPTAKPTPAAPKVPNVVLYSQYDNGGGDYILSTQRTDLNTSSAYAADDFTVPAGQEWSITQVDVATSTACPTTFVVEFYKDAGGLPGTTFESLVSSQTGLQGYGTNTNGSVVLDSSVVVSPGKYWLMVACQTTGATWYWRGRTVQSGSPAVWFEGGDYGTGCTSNWTVRTTCLPSTAGSPDQVFSLDGTSTAVSTLYDQYDNAVTTGSVSTNSQDYESANNNLDDDYAADDFVVPTETRWSLTGIDVEGTNATPDSFHVYVYTDGGNVPGSNYDYRLASPYTRSAGNFSIALSPPIVLDPGTYWISVQARMDGSQGEWGWQDRSVQSNDMAAWTNPGGGWGRGCTDWSPKSSCGVIGGPDQVFRLKGVPEVPGGTYTASDATGSIVPGTSDVGNHCDDCTTPIALPFPVDLYGVLHQYATVSSNGNIQFLGDNASRVLDCPLPDPQFQRALFPYYGDLRTDGSGEGIFTSVSGAAPNRIFNVEWRAHYFGRPGTANFEVRFYEGQAYFDYVYGATADNGAQEESGAQWSASDAAHATPYSCTAAMLTNGLRVRYTLAPPTAVRVTAFGARTERNGIRLTWRLASAADVLGFEVWRRAAAGPWRKVSGALIPARTGAGASTYRFLDARAVPGRPYAYRLRIVTASGTHLWAGTATVRG